MLKRGARVGIFAPSGAIIRENLSKGLRCLEAWGFKCYVPEQIFEKCRYLAGDDAHRANLFIELVSSGECEILWAARGGYGALRLLPFLEQNISSLKRPFWLIGFSDVSILLIYFYQRFGLITLHAPVVASLLDTSLCALGALRCLLFSQGEVRLTGEAWREGRVCRPLVGGNLASLVSLLGTPWFPDLQGKILFLEEVNEPAYRVDRMFTQLALSGALEGVEGLALGSFTLVKPRFLWELVTEIFPRGPVVSALPCGHTGQNFPLFIGAETELWAKGTEGVLSQRVTFFSEPYRENA